VLGQRKEESYHYLKYGGTVGVFRLTTERKKKNNKKVIKYGIYLHGGKEYLHTINSIRKGLENEKGAVKKNPHSKIEKLALTCSSGKKRSGNYNFLYNSMGKTNTETFEEVR